VLLNGLKSQEFPSFDASVPLDRLPEREAVFDDVDFSDRAERMEDCDGEVLTPAVEGAVISVCGKLSGGSSLNIRFGLSSIVSILFE
jgi:hypothetical protein